MGGVAVAGGWGGGWGIACGALSAVEGVGVVGWGGQVGRLALVAVGVGVVCRGDAVLFVG